MQATPNMSLCYYAWYGARWHKCKVDVHLGCRALRQHTGNTDSTAKGNIPTSARLVRHDACYRIVCCCSCFWDVATRRLHARLCAASSLDATCHAQCLTAQLQDQGTDCKQHLFACHPSLDCLHACTPLHEGCLAQQPTAHGKG